MSPNPIVNTNHKRSSSSHLEITSSPPDSSTESDYSEEPRISSCPLFITSTIKKSEMLADTIYLIDDIASDCFAGEITTPSSDP